MIRMKSCVRCAGDTYRDDDRDSSGRLISRRLIWRCLQCGREQPPYQARLPLKRVQTAPPLTEKDYEILRGAEKETAA